MYLSKATVLSTLATLSNLFGNARTATETATPTTSTDVSSAYQTETMPAGPHSERAVIIIPVKKTTDFICGSHPTSVTSITSASALETDRDVIEGRAWRKTDTVDTCKPTLEPTPEQTQDQAHPTQTGDASHYALPAAGMIAAAGLAVMGNL